jgi:UDP-N-acetylmuramyl pentapeptide phosphotransferase/UDP-N-acetylglucosamine-1-phosphate transferase
MRYTLVLAMLAGMATASWAAVWALLRTRLGHRLALDIPNERSLHQVPIPRVGGVVLFALVLPAVAWLAPELRWAAGCAAILLLVSAIDDRIGLPIALRLIVHGAVAVAAAVVLLRSGLGIQVLPIALVLVWSMNLFNFMDGSDGLAGGMALIGFATLAAAAAQGGAAALALACGTVAGASAGFLLHNFAPARVFLGDAGSIPLGFLAATTGAIGWRDGLWPAWFPVLVFSPFVVDATVTLIRRALRGEKPWLAHKEHAYQRMVAGGMGHTRTALAWYVLMLCAAVSASAGLRLQAPGTALLLAGWGLVYLGLLVLVERFFSRRA